LSLISCAPVAATALFAGCSSDDTAPLDTADASLVDSAPPVVAADGKAIQDSDTPEPFFDCTQEAAVDAPADLRCAGLYDRWSKKTIRADLKEYKPAFTFWSDGAEKRRWVFLPPGGKIDSSDMDGWKYPVGTKFFKEFVLAGKHVETRMFWKVGDTTWVKTTYKWAPDEQSATRLDTGYTPNDAGDPDAGGYEIPAVAKCDQCHNGSADKILGFEAVGLGAAGATGYTLAQLVADDRLTVKPVATTVTIPDDGKGSANALGWMHANCGTACHNKNPSANCSFKGMHLKLTHAQLAPDAGTATVTALDSYVTAVNVPASIPAGGYMRIAPKDPSESAIHFLASHRNNANTNGQMPPIDTHVVDPTGVGYLETWINALP
jgi:hypothetical protein